MESEIREKLTRRCFFGRTSRGLGSIALASLLNERIFADAASPLDLGGTLDILHHAPTAKRVIYLFQSGAPSQLDLFDPKPKLVELTGQPMPDSLTAGERVAQLMGQPLIVTGSRYSFAQYGNAGTTLSNLLPHTAKIVDDIAVIRSVHTDAINHDPAVTLIQTGGQQPGRPTMGSWISYGLGSENDQLPAFVVLTSGQGQDQPLLSRYWGNGFLPSSHQGVEFRSSGDPILFVSNPEGMSPGIRRTVLDGIRDLNQLKFEEAGDPEIETRIKAYEMAYRMQTSVPDLMDLRGESEATLEMYGAEPGKGSYANNCLLARRLVEKGVRFVQLYHRGWDAHNNLPAEIERQCLQTDRASAALIADLKQRGLLDDTLVIWGGEFGRTPMNQGDMTNGNYGRDHHMKAFAMWMAGGGIKPGLNLGATDDFGYKIVERPIHINDFQATVLHCLGVDHKKLTYRFQGRDFRLTDVGGDPVRELLA